MSTIRARSSRSSPRIPLSKRSAIPSCRSIPTMCWRKRSCREAAARCSASRSAARATRAAASSSRCAFFLTSPTSATRSRSSSIRHRRLTSAFRPRICALPASPRARSACRSGSKIPTISSKTWAARCTPRRRLEPRRGGPVLVNVRGCDSYAYTGSRAFDPALPTIVFVHGAANDHGVWALQSRYFAHHGHNVLAVDLPGHGRSGGEALPSVAAIADWLVAFLDAMRVERAILVGHSMGALAALDMAGKHPGRVAKLALLGAAVPMPVSEMLLDAAKQNDHVAFELING